MRKEYVGEAVTAGHNPGVTKTESESVTHPILKRDGNYSGRTDELWCLPHFSSCCLPGSSGLFRFVAQNLRVLSIFELREFLPATACVLIHLFVSCV